MCLLFETIKIADGRIYNLDYHQARVDESGGILNLSKIISVPKSMQSALVKCKIIYGRKLESVIYEPYDIKKIRSVKIVHDDKIDYSKKYADRSRFEYWLNQSKGFDDILIIKNGLVSDTSKANIVFADGDRWISPRYPLLLGTTRARLISQKKISQEDIKEEDITFFKSFMLINALNDFDEEKTYDISIIKM